MSDNRRPIKTRSAGWAKDITSKLVARDISPNQISVASIGFALLGAVALSLNAGVIGSLICIIGIQLRLLCNLFDGMVAIEGGKKSDVGAVYNEFPDRIADSMLIVALGYAAGWADLGWFAALSAALTAYVRVFAGSVGMQQRFIGPMAKQHRMAVMTGCLVLNIVEATVWGTHFSMMVGLAVIAFGSVATCFTRTQLLVQDMQVFRPEAEIQPAQADKDASHVDQ